MRKANPLLFHALLALTFVRLLIGSGLELSANEAYYLLWSQSLEQAYYDKGPGIALAMWFTSLLGGESVAGIRWLAPLLGLATSLLLFRLAHALYDTNIAAWAVILLNVIPIFNVGSILLTADTLALFFWMAALLCLWRALHRAHPWNPWWPLGGLCTGLGLLSSFAALFLPLSLLLLLLSSKRLRGQLRKPGPYLFLLVLTLCSLPLLNWHAKQDWITLHLLATNAGFADSTSSPLHHLAAFAGLHAVFYSPLVLAGLLWAFWLAVCHFNLEPTETFLAAFGLPIIAFSLTSTIFFTTPPPAGWTAAGFLPIGILLVHAFHSLHLNNSTRILLRSTSIGLAMLMSFLTLQTDLIRKMGVNWTYPNDPTNQLKGWHTTANAIAEILEKENADPDLPPFLIANNRQLASHLSYYLPEHIPAFQPDPTFPRIHITADPLIRNQFSLWPRYDQLQRDANHQPHSPFLGRNAWFITDNTHPINPPGEITDAFTDVTPLTTLRISRLGFPLRSIKIFHCKNYQGLEL